MRRIGMTRRAIVLVCLSALAAAGGLLAPAGGRARAQPPRVVAITAKRFEFSPSEITLKQGETVPLQLRSEDTTHGLFVRPLGIDKDCAPPTTWRAGSPEPPRTRRTWSRRPTCARSGSSAAFAAGTARPGC